MKRGRERIDSLEDTNRALENLEQILNEKERGNMGKEYKRKTYSEALREVRRNLGVRDNSGLLRRLQNSDGIVEGICMTLGCDGTENVEPDQDRGYCSLCGRQSIASPLVLMGMI